MNLTNTALRERNLKEHLLYCMVLFMLSVKLSQNESMLLDVLAVTLGIGLGSSEWMAGEDEGDFWRSAVHVLCPDSGMSENASSWKITFCALCFMYSHKYFLKTNLLIYYKLMHYVFDNNWGASIYALFLSRTLFNHHRIIIAKRRKVGIQFLSILGIGSFLGFPMYWHKGPHSQDRDEEGSWSWNKYPFNKGLVLEGNSRHVDLA